MNYYMLGSDGGGYCNFIQYKDQPIGYSDGQPFISANKQEILNLKIDKKENNKKKGETNG